MSKKVSLKERYSRLCYVERGATLIQHQDILLGEGENADAQ